MVLLGTGNVAWHLGSALFNAGIDVVQVYGRKPERAEALAAQLLATPITDLDNIIENADLYLICVTDTAIAEVAAQLHHVRGIVAHTSGSVSLSALRGNENMGVFYPLQTFTVGAAVNFNEVPILCEANTPEAEAKLMALAMELSTKVHAINSAQREKLHISAVFANNFTNHLLAKAKQICDENHIPFSILHPLILETARKAVAGNPAENQTGPAKRNDAQTLEKHLAQLTNDNLRTLYKTLSQSIQSEK
jgi:predicted short-subunit dehydrogenase-like oxidoreductase (DUF2520 family)